MAPKSSLIPWTTPSIHLHRLPYGAVLPAGFLTTPVVSKQLVPPGLHCQSKDNIRTGDTAHHVASSIFLSQSFYSLVDCDKKLVATPSFQFVWSMWLIWFMRLLGSTFTLPTIVRVRLASACHHRGKICYTSDATPIYKRKFFILPLSMKSWPIKISKMF